ncbi:hypothetical protein [Spiroplasma endosymbiont of Glossina fuscipes fuscipes]|uniref:hypothetical protein n=1 Tax=Spiroplasma endosymbiont of Glossina fuscipes fuscipes TaxID=2004463 RepID=UPI003C77EBC2
MINIAFLFETNKLTKETEDKILDKVWLNLKDDKLLKTKEDINKNFYDSFDENEIKIWNQNYNDLQKIRNILQHPTKVYQPSIKNIAYEYYSLEYFEENKKLKYKYIEANRLGIQSVLNDNEEYKINLKHQKYDIFKILINCLKLIFKHIDSYN